MKNSLKKYSLKLSSFVLLGLLLFSCGGPSICDCYEKIKNPLDMSGKDAEDCAKEFSNYSANELMNKYENECK